MIKNNKIELFGIKFSNVSYKEILDAIQVAIQTRKQITVCYANVNSINLSFKEEKITKILSQFDIIHPDGFGVFLGSKILHGREGFTFRQSGSDLYENIIEKAILSNWKVFIFGDTDETLDRISKYHPDLNVVGICNGFDYGQNKLIIGINNSYPDILIVGLGSPKQEQWIIENKNNIHSKVIIAVGDGIKVFAGTKKRGSKYIQKIGLEWFVRFLYEPKRLWRRYFIGIPLFIYRVLKLKFRKN